LKLSQSYRRIILGRPAATLVCTLAVVVFFAWRIPEFRLDASSETLLLENDPDLRAYRLVRRDYPSDDFLLIAFSPEGDLFSQENRDRLAALTDDLRALERVSAVDSILTAPLLMSPKVPVFQLLTGFRTLRSEDVDVALAREELTASPFYADFLISRDAKTTAILLRFEENERLRDLAQRRNDLRWQRGQEGLTEEESAELARVSREYQSLYETATSQWRDDVAAVRAVIDQHRDGGSLFLGGVPMIVADMVRFVRNDIAVFGLAALALLALTLAVIFRRIRWVTLPLLTCLLSAATVVGFLGWINWPATVISSNFIALTLIIGMSMAIHVIVRFRELHARQPDATPRDLAAETARLVAAPCFFCALTTMVGFGSLIVSGILPVIHFGLMMSFGIGVAFLLCFLLFPAALALLPPGAPPPAKKDHFSLTNVFANIADRHGGWTIAAAIALAGLSAYGVSRLTVENKFIDYFKEDTEIHRGMSVIDERLAGVSPLEIIIDAEEGQDWFQPENRTRLRQIHDFLDQLPETGKVLSLDTMLRVIEKYNDGQPLNPMMLGLVRRALPPDLKQEILRPFVNDDGAQIRIQAWVRESTPDLRREALLGKIRAFLREDMEFPPERTQFTGMYVLYNNMLQSLFESQILTIGAVFLATWIMFAVLFWSVKLATISILPNMLPALLVLGALGLLGIPLDMMTITIAAITIGIAVDHTIHYVHRFKREFPRLGDYRATMRLCHGSTGKAMYYTSIIIIAGFSVMALSNFIPTIYFGLFTGLAMLTALLAAMTLLPRLLIVLKPLGPERPPAEKSVDPKS